MNKSTELRTRNGGESVNTDIPQPTNGGHWEPFETASDALFWAGVSALVASVAALSATVIIYFFR